MIFLGAIPRFNKSRVVAYTVRVRTSYYVNETYKVTTTIQRKGSQTRYKTVRYNYRTVTLADGTKRYGVYSTKKVPYTYYYTYPYTYTTTKTRRVKKYRYVNQSKTRNEVYEISFFSNFRKNFR